MKNLNKRRFPTMLMAGMLGVSMMAAGACGADEPAEVGKPIAVGEAPAGTTGTAALPGTGADGFVDVASVVDNPASFAGRTVTVRGEVEEIYSPRQAFALTGDGIIAENQIMVLTKGNAGPMLEEDKQVRVNGRVRAYAVADLADYERELGWNFTPELRAELEKIKTVIIADSITLSEQR